MAHGNLAGKLVPHDFWPACENYRRFVACTVRPQHPAYPHSWHWAREVAAFDRGGMQTAWPHSQSRHVHGGRRCFLKANAPSVAR